MNERRFQLLDERPVHTGRVFGLTVATFGDSHGEPFEREVIRHPGAVAVIPIHDDGEVTLVRQFRPALGIELLEIPAGIRDVDSEAPVDTARRELAEEVGLAAESLTLLNRFHNAAGYADEEIQIFRARGLTAVDRDVQSPEEAAMTIERHSLADCLRMISHGEITDAKTIIAVLLSARG